MSIIGPPRPQSIGFVGFRWLLEHIILYVGVVAALEGIGMYNPEFLVEDNSATPFFIHLLKSVFGLHVLSGEVALVELEVHAVLAQDLWEKATLNLQNEIIDRVPENKIAFIARVGM